jgi:hypothetical protein
MGEQFDLFGKTPQMMPGASRTPINPQAGAMQRPGNVAGTRMGARPTTGSRANAAVGSGVEPATVYEVMASPQPPPTVSDVTIDRNWFSPFQPVTPFGPPWVGYPRAYDYPVGQNINFIPGRIQVFSMLRTMAQGWGLLRAVIETRKDQLMRIPWIIRTKEQAERQKSTEKTSRTAARAKDQKNPRIVMLNEFFKRPDKKMRFQQWARLLLEDLFVIDAAGHYPDRLGWVRQARGVGFGPPLINSAYVVSLFPL